MAIRKVVIPVAGTGSGLLPVTKSQPKEMLPVGRKPAVQYVVEEAAKAGLQQCLFVTGKQKSCIEDHFDKDIELEQRLQQAGKTDVLDELAYLSSNNSYWFVRQSQALGLADAVRTARDFVGNEPFVVCLGDSLITSKHTGRLLSRMIECFESHDASCVIGLEPVAEEELHHYGIADIESDDADPVRILDLVEKPSMDEAPTRWSIAARYVFSPDIFDAIEHTVPDRASGALQLTDSIRVLIHQQKNVWGVKLHESEARYDIGSFEDYFKAFVDFALRDEKYGYHLRQHLSRIL